MESDVISSMIINFTENRHLAMLMYYDREV